MIRTALFLILTFFLLNPAFSQTFIADWRFQVALESDEQGEIEVTYSKTGISQDFDENTTAEPVTADEAAYDENPISVQLYGPLNSKTLDIAPWMNNDGRLNVFNVVMSSGKNHSGSKYQLMLSYFLFMNTGQSLMNSAMPLPSKTMLISPGW